MKILFYDGDVEKLYAETDDFNGIMEEIEKRVSPYPDHVRFINAKYGPKSNEEMLDELLDLDQTRGLNVVVVTNSLVALSNKYCWDQRTGRCELYIFRPDKKWFVNAQELTEKEIREGHNLEALYRNGTFDL